MTYYGTKDHDHKDKPYLYETGGLIHKAELHEIHRDVTLAWTKCSMDVPAGKLFKAYEAVTCPDCLTTPTTSKET